MKEIPSGTELVRPFVPARDLDLAKAFYEALGFDKIFDSDVAIFAAGAGGFVLCREPREGWAGSFVMQLMVDDLDVWWAHIEGLDLPARFKVQPPRAPAVQPWGLRTAYLFDPSGVLWHVAERRPGMRQD
jgi:hypothetical protein